MKITAIMPTCNRLKMAQDAVVQFMRQDYPDRELIVLDDSDDADPVLQSIKHFPMEHIRYIYSQPKQNHGEKMDRLFRLATETDFVCVWDDDDIYATDRLTRLVQPMLADPRLMAVGTGVIYYVNERLHKAYRYDNRKLPHRVKTNLVWLGAPMYRRSSYELYGPWESKPGGADHAYMLKFDKRSILDLEDDSLMVCRIHESNAASKSIHSPAWVEVKWEDVPCLT